MFFIKTPYFQHLNLYRSGRFHRYIEISKYRIISSKQTQLASILPHLLQKQNVTAITTVLIKILNISRKARKWLVCD